MRLPAVFALLLLPKCPVYAVLMSGTQLFLAAYPACSLLCLFNFLLSHGFLKKTCKMSVLSILFALSLSNLQPIYHSFIHLFIHSFIHSFILSFVFKTRDTSIGVNSAFFFIFSIQFQLHLINKCYSFQLRKKSQYMCLAKIV